MKAKKMWKFHDDDPKMLRAAKSRDRWVSRVNNCLFQLDRLPAVAFAGPSPLPGFPRRGRPSAASADRVGGPRRLHRRRGPGPDRGDLTDLPPDPAARPCLPHRRR